MRYAFLQIDSCQDEAAFQSAVNGDDALDCFIQAGWTGVPCFEEKEKLCEELCLYFVIDKARSAIEAFKEGLSTLNILTLMKSHPALFKEAFCHKLKPLTASDVDNLLVPSYAEEGTRVRDKQECIVMHWRDYLLDCEGLYMIH